MIGRAEFMRFMQEAQVTPDTISEQLEAWEVDEQSFDHLTKGLVRRWLSDYIKGEDLELLGYMLFWMGYEFGFRSAVELEIQKRVNDA